MTVTAKIAAVAVAVVALDQVTKYLVETRLPLYGPSTPVIPGILVLTRCYNTGVAFGQLKGGGVLLIGIAIAAVLVLLTLVARLARDRSQALLIHWIGLALPIGGAVGNLIDRVRIGKVIDFFDFGWFPVFNVADSAITVGAVLLVTYFTFFQHATNQPAPNQTTGESVHSGTEPNPGVG